MAMEDKLLPLIKLLTDFQNIERSVMVPKTQRPENDTEHSYNLALAAWIIIATDQLPLDTDKVLRYALVHDLVELSAGDSNALRPDQTATKAAREAEALQKIEQNELLLGLAGDIRAYESKADEEAKFVYALDKIMPGLGIIYGKGSTWIDHNLSQSEWEAIFRTKAETSKFVLPYLECLIRQQKAHPELFGKTG